MAYIDRISVDKATIEIFFHNLFLAAFWCVLGPKVSDFLRVVRNSSKKWLNSFKQLKAEPAISLVSNFMCRLRARAYLDAVQQFAHAPEAVSLNVPQSLFLETGHVKVFHLLL